MTEQRFDKIIASQFNISRKDARAGIRKGKGVVDGQVVKDPAAQISVNSQIVFDGKKLNYKEHIYILMNKPKGVLSASSDKKKQTVVDLVPKELKRNNLFPVGRLDKDTTGLLIITDDGEFAHNAISPKKDIFKTYIAELDGEVTEQMVDIFANGVVLADGTVCKKAYLRPLCRNKAEIKISEGKYHQIKRMFGRVGLGVNQLSRVAFGSLRLDENLNPGQCRELETWEIKAVLSQD
jgi:16S rRNA pseudouridine516 synthase